MKTELSPIALNKMFFKKDNSKMQFGSFFFAESNDKIKTGFAIKKMSFFHKNM